MGSHPDPLIFMHMPKCGGTTLQNEIVRPRYRGGRIHHLDGHRDGFAAFRDLPQADRHSVNLLVGHMHFGLHDWLRPGATYMTMLREPVDRVISLYHFVLRKPDQYLWERGFNRDITLHQFLEQRESVELDNFQTRKLCAEPSEPLPFGHVTEAMRDEALANLDRIAAVGLMERFDDSLRVLAHRFGWRDLAYQPLNVTSDRPRAADLDPVTLKLIREFNQHDLLVYEKAQDMFRRQLAEAEAGPAATSLAENASVQTADGVEPPLLAPAG